MLYFHGVQLARGRDHLGHDLASSPGWKHLSIRMPVISQTYSRVATCVSIPQTRTLLGFAILESSFDSSLPSMLVSSSEIQYTIIIGKMGSCAQPWKST